MQVKKAKITTVYLLIASVNAYPSTLEFKGEIKHPTCQVKVNNITQYPAITLPTINIQQLKDSGDSAGETKFEITIFDCLRSMTLEQNWDVRFSPWGIDKNRDSLIPGFIPMMAGTARGIGLQIFNTDSGMPINNEFIDDLLIGYHVKNAIKIQPGESQGSQNFSVRYLSLGDTSPGSITSYVQYSVGYF